MKGFGRLILILGLASFASVVYTHAWNTAFGRGPLADTFEEIEKIGAKSKRIAKEAKEAGEENRGKNRAGNSEETKKSDVADFKEPPIDTQYKKEKVSNNDTTNEIVPGLLPGIDNDSIVRSSKRRRKREDPFKDVVLQTTSGEIHGNEAGSLKKQSVIDAYKNKSTTNETPFTSSIKAPKVSISKSKNISSIQKQTSELIDQIPSEENIITDVTETIK
jgi:hypothetical protein